MTPQSVEERLTAVERELQHLKQLVTASRADDVQLKPGWRSQVEGSMKDLEGFEEMVRLGREWARSEMIEDDNARMDSNEE